MNFEKEGGDPLDYEQLAVDVERARAGDEDAFARLYEKTCQIVYSIAASKLKDTEKAKDVVSEVYIRVFRYLSTLRDSRSFVRWLMVITDNVCAEHKNDRRTDAALQALYPDQMPDTDDPIEDWEKKEGLRELMKGLIHLLPEAQQRTVYYFYFKQLTLSQIAAIENCPVNTVKTRLFHARDTLRRAILEEEKRSGDKYHLPVATVAMAAVMALPDTGFTLAAEDASRIFLSVLTALGMQYTGERSASFVTVIHEDADDGSLHAKLFRRSYLVKLSPAMTLLAVLLTLLLAATAGIAYFRKAALPAAALSNDPIACASAADAALPLPAAASTHPEKRILKRPSPQNVVTMTPSAITPSIPPRRSLS